MRRTTPLLIVLIVGIATLSLAAVIKKRGPVVDTQTDPIAYQEELKRETEGKKAPPTPTIELFPRQGFLSEGPVAKTKGRSRSKRVEKEKKGQLWVEEGNGNADTKEEGEKWEWQDVKEEGEKDDTQDTR